MEFDGDAGYCLYKIKWFYPTTLSYGYGLLDTFSLLELQVSKWNWNSYLYDLR